MIREKIKAAALGALGLTGIFLALSAGLVAASADLSEAQLQLLTDIFLLSFTVGGVLVGIAGHLYDNICQAERAERQERIRKGVAA